MSIKVIELASTTVALNSIEIATGKQRQNERLAAHSAVAHLLGDVAIGHYSDGAPFIENSDIKISVSHSRNIAAVAIDTEFIIGIDIEQARPSQLRRIAARVLSEPELDYYNTSDEHLLQAWTLKEALCKASGRLDADFRRDIILPTSNDEKKALVATPEGGATGFDIIFSQAVELDGIDAWMSVVRIIP